jgi:hypothetical protein
MTIAAGFRCSNGVLLLVDSQHTAGNTKYHGTKVWKLSCGDGSSSLILTAAGPSPSIVDTMDFIKFHVENLKKDITLENVKDVIRTSNPGEGTVLLVGVSLQDDDFAQLLRCEQDGQGTVRINQLDPTLRQKCFFTGTEVAEAMCHEMFEWFPIREIGVLQMREIGKHVLGRICEYAEFCSRPIQSSYILDDAARLEYFEGFEDFRLPDYSPGREGHLLGVYRLLGDTISECLNFEETKESSFERSLQELVDKLREMRRKAKGEWIVLD